MRWIVLYILFRTIQAEIFCKQTRSQKCNNILTLSQCTDVQETETTTVIKTIPEANDLAYNEYPAYCVLNSGNQFIYNKGEYNLFGYGQCKKTSDDNTLTTLSAYDHYTHNIIDSASCSARESHTGSCIVFQQSNNFFDSADLIDYTGIDFYWFDSTVTDNTGTDKWGEESLHLDISDAYLTNLDDRDIEEYGHWSNSYGSGHYTRTLPDAICEKWVGYFNDKYGSTTPYNWKGNAKTALGLTSVSYTHLTLPTKA